MFVIGHLLSKGNARAVEANYECINHIHSQLDYQTAIRVQTWTSVFMRAGVACRDKNKKPMNSATELILLVRHLDF